MQNASRKREIKVTSSNGRVRDDGLCSDHGPTMVESAARTLNDTATVFGQFLLDFGMQFFVAGASNLVMLEGHASCSAHCK